jgi:hypothetical protein
MKVNDREKAMVKITREEILAEFFPEGIPKYLLQKPAPPPKPATGKAQERWSAQKPISAVLQDARRAEAAATERLRREREERSERIAAEHRRACYQAEIDAAWQRSRDYQAELAQWSGCHRGPGDPDWRRGE